MMSLNAAWMLFRTNLMPQVTYQRESVTRRGNHKGISASLLEAASHMFARTRACDVALTTKSKVKLTRRPPKFTSPTRNPALSTKGGHELGRSTWTKATAFSYHVCGCRGPLAPCRTTCSTMASHSVK